MDVVGPPLSAEGNFPSATHPREGQHHTRCFAMSPNICQLSSYILELSISW